MHTEDVSVSALPLVLVLNSEVESRQRVTTFLSVHGWRTTTAADRGHGLMLAVAERPDIIAAQTDHETLRAADVCHDFRAWTEIQDIPLIVVTETATLARPASRVALSICTSVLVKPCSPERLLEEINRLLSVRHASPTAEALASCPWCTHTTGRFLPNMSADAEVDHYRCWTCGHVWTLAKGASVGVSARPKPDRRASPRSALSEVASRSRNSEEI
jgi:DNA-binding response OmpR family regulator